MRERSWQRLSAHCRATRDGLPPPRTVAKGVVTLLFHYPTEHPAFTVSLCAAFLFYPPFLQILGQSWISNPHATHTTHATHTSWDGHPHRPRTAGCWRSSRNPAGQIPGGPLRMPRPSQDGPSSTPPQTLPSSVITERVRKRREAAETTRQRAGRTAVRT